MKKRFSSRHGSSMLSDSTLATSELHLSTLSHQSLLDSTSLSSIASDESATLQRRQDAKLAKKKENSQTTGNAPATRKSNRRTKLATATIDKYFIPENIVTAVSSPTRFQRPEGSSDDNDDEQDKTARSRKQSSDEGRGGVGRRMGTRKQTSAREENLIEDETSGPEVHKKIPSRQNGTDADVSRESTTASTSRSTPDDGGQRVRDTYGASSEVDGNRQRKEKAGVKGRSPLQAQRSPTALEGGEVSSSTSGVSSTRSPQKRLAGNRPAVGDDSDASSSSAAIATAGSKKSRSHHSEDVIVPLSRSKLRTKNLTETSSGETSSSGKWRRAVQSSSGVDSDQQVADQEFVHALTNIVTTPFMLEAGPSDWIQAWKKKHGSSEEDESDSLPDRIVAKAVTKLNKKMEQSFQKRLSRQQQRDILKQLVDAREADRATGAALGTHLRAMEEKLMTDPKSLLASFPEEWTDSTTADERSEDLLQRYASLRSRFSKLVGSLSADRDQLLSNQVLLQSLESINKLNIPDSDDLKEELDRSRTLVTKVMEKLKKNKQRKGSPQKSSPRKKLLLATRPTLPNQHTALKCMLFGMEVES